jgi:putative ABC transport system substrate-binding protein
MKRREFITLLGGTAAVWPLAARAQSLAAAPRVGLLSIGAVPERPVVWEPFFDRMRELGYEDGHSVVYVRGFGAGHAELIETMVREVIAAKPALLVVTGAVEALAVQRVDPPMPCVMFLAADPIGAGLVPSLARPGGRFTGLTTMDLELDAKRVDLLHEAIPELTRARLLTTGRRGSSNQRRAALAQELRASAQTLGVALEIVQADAPDGTERAISDAAAAAVRGLLVSFDAPYYAHRREIVDAAQRHRVPAIYGARDFVAVGGLMSYSAQVAGLSRRAAEFADRILRGADAATLPVEQPTKFELVINLKTAKALGLEVPSMLLALADEVIE